MNYEILAINYHSISNPSIKINPHEFAMKSHPRPSPLFTAFTIHRSTAKSSAALVERQVFGASVELSLKLSVDRALQQAMAKAEAVLQETGPSVPKKQLAEA